MSAPAAPPLGVVIVSFNTAALLDACLRSVRDALAGLGWLEAADVVVVDNASADDSVAFVQRHHGWVRLIERPRNEGFTAANNVVLRPWADGSVATPRAVLLLNPDAALTPGALPTMLDALRDDATAAVVGPLLRYPDGRFQHAAFRYPGLLQTALDLWPIPRLMDTPLNGRYPRRRYERGQPFPVDAVLGACMLVRGDALRTVGPLDDGYVMYSEELDWCRRFRSAGWRVLCAPQAVVLHHGGASSGQFRATSFIHLWRSRLRYFDKHLWRPHAALVRMVARTGFRWQDAADRRAVRSGAMSLATSTERRAARAAVFAVDAP
ncbi:MAG: glycosyltransferase family 2 protein [Ardenticatenales bacterium]